MPCAAWADPAGARRRRRSRCPSSASASAPCCAACCRASRTRSSRASSTWPRAPSRRTCGPCTSCWACPRARRPCAACTSWACSNGCCRAEAARCTMDASSPLSGSSQLVERELLDLFARRSWRVPLAVMFASVLIATLAWGKAPDGLALGWLLAVALSLSLRATVLWRLPRLERLSVRLRLRIVMLLYALSGTAYAASFLLWPYLSDLERAVQSMFLLAVCAGGVVAQVGYLPVFT